MIKGKKPISKSIHIVLLLSVVVLLLPIFLRFNNPTFDYNVYYHLRAVEAFAEKGFFQPDGLILGNRPFKISLMDAIISYFPEKEFLIKIFPFITGFISLYIYYIILNKLKISKDISLTSSYVLVLSPIFIHTFTIYNDYFIVVLLILLGILNFLNEKIFPSIIFFGLAPLFNPHSIILVLLSLSLVFKRFKTIKPFMIYLIVIISTIIFFKEAGYIEPELNLPSLRDFISEFGAEVGFGVFSLILVFCGIVFSWRDKEKYYFYYFLIFILGIISIEFDFSKFFLDCIFVFFAGMIIDKIRKIKWEIKLLKQYTILLMICGLLFSATSAIKTLASNPPYNDEKIALEWLGDNSPNNSVILSHYKYGFMIEYISNRTVIIDKLYIDTSKEKFRLLNTSDFFLSSNFKRINEIIEYYGITHIYITKEMKEGLVWRQKEEGINLLLMNSDRFKKIYDFKGTEIWKIKEE